MTLQLGGLETAPHPCTADRAPGSPDNGTNTQAGANTPAMGRYSAQGAFSSASDVCPVCHGRGKQFDTDNFVWTDLDCKACDGTGQPMWKQGASKRRGSDTSLQHLAEYMVGMADTYAEYERECRYAGLAPVSQQSYNKRRAVRK